MDSNAISLTGGKIAFISNDDYEFLMQYNWYAYRVRKTEKWYARGCITIDGRRIRIMMHRAIMEHNGYDLTGVIVDHINGDGLDNRLENLRPVTKAQNAYNRRKRAGHTSKYKGVYFDRQRGKWKASIKVDGKTISLGRFLTEEEAALKYNEAAIMYFSEHAHLNVLPMVTLADVMCVMEV